MNDLVGKYMMIEQAFLSLNYFNIFKDFDKVKLNANYKKASY